jgi:hypothetical protein
MSYEPRDHDDSYGRDDYGQGGYAPDDHEARARTSTPGILLIVVGVLNILGGLYFVLNGVTSLMNPDAVLEMQEKFNPDQAKQIEQMGMSAEQFNQYVAYGTIATGAVGALAALLMIMGGVQMRNLHGYALAMFASILALIPCISPSGCCILGQVAGIWAIAVLLNQDVKSAFR